MAFLTELAAALATTEANAIKRAVLLKVTPVCDRCGGSGQYSFNQVDGSRCYGCGGSGHVAPKAKQEAATLEAAREAAADGRLAVYLARLDAARFCKGASDRIFAAWKATRVSRSTAGVATHTWSEAEVPGLAEVRAAAAAMHAAYQRFAAAERALNPKAPTYAADVVALAQTVRETLVAIAAADIEPSPEFLAYVQPRQEAARARVIANGATPGF